jgi:hypothetical protein
MTKTQTFATGDIVQDRFGWFFRINADDTADQLSAAGTVTASAIKNPVVLVHADGTPATGGDALARRVAVVMARRYEGSGSAR